MRLTRKEQQSRTRQALLEAAERVFARRGLARASVEEIAAEAGFTKGAVYANFGSKDELALAMLDESFARRVQVLKELEDGGGSATKVARAGGIEFAEYVAGDPQWRVLFFEFAMHATRDRQFGERLVQRYGALIDVIAHAVAQKSVELGLEEPESQRSIALMIFAVGNGVALQQLLDPEGTPRDLFADMLELLILGAITKAQSPVAS
jgi:AcrR family transcriptional regulator